MKRENVYKPVTYTQQYILFMNVIIIFNNNSSIYISWVLFYYIDILFPRLIMLKRAATKIQRLKEF